MLQIIINKLESQFCRERADLVVEHLKKQGWKNQTAKTNNSDTENFYRGFLGEFAFCKLFNCYPDTEIKNPDLCADCWLPFVGTIDVKQTECESGHLMVEGHKINSPAQYYALMTRRGRVFRFAGIASAEQLFQPQNFYILSGCATATYNLKQKDLQQLSLPTGVSNACTYSSI